MQKFIDLGIGALLATGIVLVFRDPLSAMVNQWDVSPMYSYGYTVAPISAFLIWSRRDELKQSPLRPARFLGALVFAVSIGLLAVGQAGALQVFQQIGFVVAVPAVVLFLFGTRALRICAPAIAYLLFMVPVWDAITEPLHWPFQTNSAKLGVELMQLAGVPAYRDGTFIALPNVLLEVARECSGINYLVAVTALALPLAWLRLRQTWRRLLLVASALTIAALANGVRVALIGALAYAEIGSPLHGPFHMLHGLFVAAIGYVVLFVGLRLLQEKESESSISTEATEPALAAQSRWRVSAFGLAVTFWILATIGVVPDVHAVTLARPLEELPGQLGNWTATSTTATEKDDERLPFWPGADRMLQRRYVNADGRSATVGIWYFETQKQGQEMVSHFVSDLHRQSTAVSVASRAGQHFRANRLPWTPRGEAWLFWYDLGNKPESSQYAAKLQSLWNALWSGRSNGAAIMLRTAGAGDDAKAFSALEDLAAEIQPAMIELWFADIGANNPGSR